MEPFESRSRAVREPFESRRGSPPPSLRLCLDEDRDGYAKGWQTVPLAPDTRYFPGLVALLATIRGEQPPDRTLEHELVVQETLLRAIGLA